jgi:hypothetical protein
MWIKARRRPGGIEDRYVNDLYKIRDNLSELLHMIQHLDPDTYYSVMAHHISEMAKNGNGTDVCLEHGCLPLPVHFYSPVPDIADLQRRNAYCRKSELAGIEWNVASQVEFFLYLGRRFGTECAWSAHPTGNPEEFYTENSNFSFGCAAALHCMIRFFQPQRIAEVGSGNSSKIINDAIGCNIREFGSRPSYTVIDPYPEQARINRLVNLSRVVPDLVENVPVSFFSELGDGDILFIDSSHMVKTGGDVNFLILDVLPTLAPGVVIHFHDIPMPNEYPEVWHTNPAFRAFFTESYLLQAFLSCNAEFEVLLSMAVTNKNGDELIQRAFPHYDPMRHSLQSGSIWLRRKKSI